uniref:Uncharacterized protein n=1 Tax=Musa acuminata subsp. malaccensis TaxID=214687 RepID=A0A804HN60_MUSAM
MVLCPRRDISDGVGTLAFENFDPQLRRLSTKPQSPNFSSSSSPFLFSSSFFLSLFFHTAAAFSGSLRTKAERLKRWDLSFCAFCSLVLVFIIFTIRSLGFTYRSSDSFFFFFWQGNPVSDRTNPLKNLKRSNKSWASLSFLPKPYNAFGRGDF